MAQDFKYNYWLFSVIGHLAQIHSVEVNGFPSTNCSFRPA